MPGFVLTEYQSACRAAQEQALLLEDLYQRLLNHDAWSESAGFPAGERARELREFRELLEQALHKEDLLPTQPDPEKEELLELVTELKGALTANEHAAIADRLVSEECGLLRLGEQMQERAPSDAIDRELARTRSAVRRLERFGGPETGS